MKKTRNVLKKYPVLIGMFAIAVLLGLIVLYWFWQRQQEVVSTVIPEELAREATIEKLKAPELVVEYIFAAAQQNDLDMALRAFPIDEVCLAFDADKLTEIYGELTLKTMPAPSGLYEQYFPLASVEYTEMCAESFENFMSGLPQDAKIKDISYLKPTQQMTAEILNFYTELNSAYGSRGVCEMTALIESEENTYAAVFTLICYDDYWKLLSFESESKLSDIDQSFQLIKEAKYKKNTDSSKQEQLKDELEETLFGEMSKDQKKEKEQNIEMARKQIESGNALLTPNYFVTCPAYGKTPRDTLKRFTLYLQRGDITSAICFGNTSGKERELEHTTLEALNQQTTFAEQIKNLWYTVLLNQELFNEGDYSKLDKDNDMKQTLSKLSLEHEFFLSFDGLDKTEEKDKFIAYYFYGERCFEIEVSMIETEQGWQIKSFDSMKKLSKEEYETKIQ